MLARSRAVLASTRPDAVIHEMTDLTGASDLRHFDRVFATSNQLRTKGTDILLTAARETGVRRFVAQSYCGWPYARVGGAIKTEADALDPDPPAELPHNVECDPISRTNRHRFGAARRYCIALRLVLWTRHRDAGKRRAGAATQPTDPADRRRFRLVVVRACRRCRRGDSQGNRTRQGPGASTISQTMTLPRSGIGFRRLPTSSVRSGRIICRHGLPAWSPATTWFR